VAHSEPIDDVENGFFDVQVTVKLTVTFTNHGPVDEERTYADGESAHTSEIDDMGSCFDNFIDSEDVHNVVCSTYLKDLGSHQDSQKRRTQHVDRN